MKMESIAIKFSILVPVYNVRDYVEACIQSVLAQTYVNYELILVDDGSMDGSGAICDRYAAAYPNIQVYHKPNKGLIHTRRFALQYATGDYYIMLDSDDLLEPFELEVLHQTINRHHCDCVFFNMSRLIGTEKVKLTHHIQEGYVTDRRIIQRKALIENFSYNALVLKCARADLFTNEDYSGYYHIRLGEDLLQSLELLRNCRTAEFIDDALYIYRYRVNSIVNSKSKTEYCVDFTVREATLRFIREEGLFTEQDMNDYRDKCVGLLINQISLIGSLNCGMKKKIQYYNEIRESNYYREFLSGGIADRREFGVKSFIYTLFRLKWDVPIIFVNMFRSRFRRVIGRKDKRTDAA